MVEYSLLGKELKAKTSVAEKQFLILNELSRPDEKQKYRIQKC